MERRMRRARGRLRDDRAPVGSNTARFRGVSASHLMSACDLPSYWRNAGWRRRPAGGRRDGLSTHRRRWYRASSFPCLCLSFGALPPGIRSGQRKRRGRSNSSSTRQTVSVLPIRPSPLTRGQPPSPGGPSRLLGAKSHKTSVLLLGLCVSCIPDVCGTSFGAVLGKDSIAGVGVGFIGSSSGPSQQGLELCEDLLDRIEIGRVFGEERRRAPTSRITYDTDRPACDCADRVGDEKRRYPVASIGLGAFFARLSAKLDREADASAEGLR